MGDLVGGHGLHAGAVGSGALKQAMHQIQHREGQPADRRHAQPLAGRPIRRRPPHHGIIHQLGSGMQPKHEAWLSCCHARSTPLLWSLLPAARPLLPHGCPSRRGRADRPPGVDGLVWVLAGQRTAAATGRGLRGPPSSTVEGGGADLRKGLGVDPIGLREDPFHGGVLPITATASPRGAGRGGVAWSGLGSGLSMVSARRGSWRSLRGGPAGTARPRCRQGPAAGSASRRVR